MTTRRRPTPTGWKPPRDRREVMVAALASTGLVVATIGAIVILAPRDDSGPQPTGITIPTTSTVTPTTTTTTPPTP